MFLARRSDTAASGVCTKAPFLCSENRCGYHLENCNSRSFLWPGTVVSSCQFNSCKKCYGSGSNLAHKTLSMIMS